MVLISDDVHFNVQYTAQLIIKNLILKIFLKMKLKKSYYYFIKRNSKIC